MQLGYLHSSAASMIYIMNTGTGKIQELYGLSSKSYRM